MSENNKKKVCAAVIIGRNEGERLVSCLESLLASLDVVVYVDSGSSDNSLEEASRRGVHCLPLDLSIPFTAARARNEGVEYLFKKHSDLKYIQFVDGDCEVQPEWVGEAQNFLDNNSQYAVVCGRRRERYPNNSIYNQLCDIEWNTPVDDALACGGDALVRAAAFKQVGGYRDDLIAGEEPEMCFRLRANGWKIYRLDAEMTLHDAAITHFSQWWNRAKRAGYAYAGGYDLHGRSAEKFKRKQVFSIIVWAFMIPVIIILLAFQNYLLLGLFVIFPVQVLRLMLKEQSRLSSYKLAWFYALSNVVGKFPQFIGIVKFITNKMRGRKATLIEYK